jgi:hypothetical protein
MPASDDGSYIAGQYRNLHAKLKRAEAVVGAAEHFLDSMNGFTAEDRKGVLRNAIAAYRLGERKL